MKDFGMRKENCVYTDHQFFEKYHRLWFGTAIKERIFLVEGTFDLQGDYVVHVNYGIGIYEG